MLVANLVISQNIFQKPVTLAHGNQRLPLPLVSVPVQTCTGSGELYLYQQDPFQPIATTLQVNRDQLLIFTRGDAALQATVDGNASALQLAAEVATPFRVKVYALSTHPGSTVAITGSHANGARGVQGYLAQNPAQPLFDLANLHAALSETSTSEFVLTPGTYSYVFFDKYTENRPGQGQDERPLQVQVSGPSGVIREQIYRQPQPAPAEGAVVDTFTVPDGQAGTYTLQVETRDSIYWPPLASCPTGPTCGDNVREGTEACDDGARNGEACIPGYGTTCQYCAADCQLATVVGPACGDRTRQDPEECDDGNLANFDGCNAQCRPEQFSCQNPVIIEFERDGNGTPIAAGQTIDDEFSALGVTVSADNRIAGHPDTAITFDSVHPSGAADSLDEATPNEFFGGRGVGNGGVPSNNVPLGNTLIIPRQTTDANGDQLVDDPAEDSGGTLQFTFAAPVFPQQITLVDLDHNDGQHAAIGSLNGASVSTTSIPLGGDNSVQYLSLDGAKAVDRLTVTVKDSFGFANLVFCPLPPRTTCGDGQVQTPNSDGANEPCDNGTSNGIACTADYGQTCRYCAADCQLATVAGPACGDGIKNGSEPCDGSDGVTAGNRCTAQCTLETIPPPPPPPPPSPPGGGGGGSGGGGGGGGGGIVRSARLTMSKSVNPERACPGTEVTYEIKVTNIGNLDGRNLRVQDVLPAGFVHATTSQTSFQMDLGDIKRDETKTIRYGARVGPTVGPGLHKNRATAEISNAAPPNNSSTVAAALTVPEGCGVGRPVISLEKTADRPFLNPGGSVTFTLTVQNSGTATATDVTLHDLLPTGFHAPDGVTRWSLGDLGPGVTRTVTLLAQTTATTTSGTYENIATVAAVNHTPDDASATVEVRAGQVLGVEFNELPKTGGALARTFTYVSANLLALAYGLLLERKTRRTAYVR